MAGSRKLNDFINEVVRELKVNGFVGQKCVCEYSPISVVAFNFSEVKFIQAKACKKNGESVLRRELKALKSLVPFVPSNVSLEVWVKEDRKEVLRGVVE